MDVGDVLKEAIAKGQSIQISYHDESRIVDPYVLGTSSSGNFSLQAYQQGDRAGWRLFTVEKIDQITFLPTRFDVRIDYKADDKGFTTIAARREP